jgi:hypothetical protein
MWRILNATPLCAASISNVLLEAGAADKASRPANTMILMRSSSTNFGNHTEFAVRGEGTRTRPSAVMMRESMARPEADRQRQAEQAHERDEQYLRDVRGRSGDAAQAQEPGDHRDHEKHY